MKKIHKINTGFLFFSVAIVLILLMPACKKNVAEPGPVITGVINYAATPGDTALSGIVPDGQWVVITGQHLQNALQINFNGVPATFNNALFAPNNVVVQIPSIVFSAIDTNTLNTIEYTTPGGTTTFSFRLTPAAPTITAISNVFANPGDSVFIYGANLVLVQTFSYGGTNISSFKSNMYGTALGFVMPTPAPSSGDAVVTTRSGTVIFKISATPTITGVSNENAKAGDSVYIYGTYLKSIQTFTFAGESITSFASSADGSSVGFVLPVLSQSGPVSITTAFGTATTVYKVNETAGLGSISNWEWNGNFNWQWWGGATLNSGDPNSGWPPYNPDFPGNSSMYMSLKNSVLTPGEGNTYSNYAILMNGAQWVPTVNINDPVGEWAFKMEVNIPQPWNGGSLVVQSGDNTYIYRGEPWQVSATTTAPYKTKGWITVTIPFTEFRKTDATLGDGKGASMTKFADLLGSSGNSGCTVYMHNYSTSATATGFYGAFDNLRVVKIK
ncbi:MAG: glycan-binding surface protein [Chitinophagaceae bacterium]